MKITSIKKIEAELKELKIAVFEVEKCLEKSYWNMIEKIGVGSSLASIYGGYERIFNICLENEGIKIPKSEYWHTDLLRNAIKNNFAPDDMQETLRGMLSYRHKQVHGYGHQMDSNILRESVKDVTKTFPVFLEHINGLLMDKEQANTENHVQNSVPNMGEVQAAESKASMVQQLDKSADGSTNVEGKDINYIEEGYMAAANEVKYEAQEARTANSEAQIKVGDRVSFTVKHEGREATFTGTILSMSDRTVVMKCGDATLPILKDKVNFKPAQELPKEHTKEHAQEEAQKHVGSSGKVFLAKSKETYKGKIVAKTPTFAIQKVNENTAILHRLKDLEGKDKDSQGMIREGEDLKIMRDGTNVSIERIEKGKEHDDKVRDRQKSRGSQSR